MTHPAFGAQDTTPELVEGVMCGYGNQAESNLLPTLNAWRHFVSTKSGFYHLLPI